MKINRFIKVSSSEFFDYIEKGLIEDLKKNNVLAEDTEDYEIKSGLEYTKELKSTSSKNNKLMNVVIEEFILNESYRVKFKTDEAVYSISYLIEDAVGGININYQENFEKLKKESRLLRFLFGRKKNKKSHLLGNLMKIEREIIGQRKEKI